MCNYVELMDATGVSLRVGKHLADAILAPQWTDATRLAIGESGFRSTHRRYSNSDLTRSTGLVAPDRGAVLNNGDFVTNLLDSLGLWHVLAQFVRIQALRLGTPRISDELAAQEVRTQLANVDLTAGARIAGFAI